MNAALVLLALSAGPPRPAPTFPVYVARVVPAHAFTYGVPSYGYPLYQPSPIVAAIVPQVAPVVVQSVPFGHRSSIGFGYGHGIRVGPVRSFGSLSAGVFSRRVTVLPGFRTRGYGSAQLMLAAGPPSAPSSPPRPEAKPEPILKMPRDAKEEIASTDEPKVKAVFKTGNQWISNAAGHVPLWWTMVAGNVMMAVVLFVFAFNYISNAMEKTEKELLAMRERCQEEVGKVKNAYDRLMDDYQKSVADGRETHTRNLGLLKDQFDALNNRFISLREQQGQAVATFETERDEWSQERCEYSKRIDILQDELRRQRDLLARADVTNYKLADEIKNKAAAIVAARQEVTNLHNLMSSERATFDRVRESCDSATIALLDKNRKLTEEYQKLQAIFIEREAERLFVVDSCGRVGLHLVSSYAELSEPAKKRFIDLASQTITECDPAKEIV